MVGASREGALWIPVDREISALPQPVLAEAESALTPSPTEAMAGPRRR